MSGMSDDSREAIPEGANGLPLKVLKNGVLVDTARGRIVAGSHPTTAIRTSERGRELAARRTELAKAKARKAISEAYEQDSGKPGRPTDAYAQLAGEFYRSAIANAMDKPREAVQASAHALRLADMLPADDKRAAPAVAVQVNIGGELAAYYSKQAAEDEGADA